jgi:enamine deaminase RidA (YjgF/YER057c/UK114 family)
MTTIEQRLEELGFPLPEPPAQLGLYLPGVQTGNLLFLSGQTPQIGGRAVVCGLVGRDLDVAEAADGARLAALNALAQARSVLGSLGRIKRVVRITGYVASVESFGEHPAVVDGATRLLVDVFGERGWHARSAIGVASLPQRAAVELDVIFEVEGT